MITLFIDTSTTTLTVALIKDNKVLEESTVSSSEHSKHTMPEIEKLFKMTKFTDEGAVRFARKLRAMGIDEKLLEMGAKYGDKVQIMDLIFEFKE